MGEGVWGLSSSVSRSREEESFGAAIGGDCYIYIYILVIFILIYIFGCIFIKINKCRIFMYVFKYIRDISWVYLEL